MYYKDMSRIYATALVLVFISILSLNCTSDNASSSGPEEQIVTVGKGDIRIEITAGGNLKTSNEANLTFYSSGTVKEVLVEIGDSIAEGEVLARLDTLSLERSVQQAEIDVKSARMSLERAKEPKTNSSGTEILTAPDPLDIEIKEFQLETAKMNLEEEKIKLENATMVAPFAGLVAEVNVADGDQVSESTVAVRLIDPKRFAVDVMVSEMDIYKINVGTTATVNVEALPSIVFPAKVAYISPVATVQSNVVNYPVQVELESLDTLQEQRQEQITPSGSTGEISERFKEAIESGQMTQEQVDEMMSRRQQRSQSGQTAAALPEGFLLREGLTVTVTIVVDEASGVLMVPNAAITSRGRQTSVRVMLPDGVTEERQIETGISNWQYTEVVGGLSEGEQIVVLSQSTVSPTTSSPQYGPPGSSDPTRQIQRMLR
jgi:RND family efflux transporter MFP subunit